MTKRVYSEPTEHVNALAALTKYGNHPKLKIILFTLDETTYSRELAPLVGHYPSLKLGPAWWFHDSPAGMLRFRQQTTETAGFYNTVGFNDDELFYRFQQGMMWHVELIAAIEQSLLQIIK